MSTSHQRPRGSGKTTATKDRIATQRAEFQAASELGYHYDRLSRTPVVDDDYPMVRHGYESALVALIAAMKDNQRFAPGNRYGITP